MKQLKDIANKALEALVLEGAQKGKCTVTLKEKREFNVDGGEFSLFRTLFDKSLSLMVIKDQKKGNISINQFDEQAVEAAMKECIQVAESGSPDEAWDIAPKVEATKFSYGQMECDTELLFIRSQELLNQIKEFYPKILVEQMIISHEKETCFYANTNGTEFEEIGGRYLIEVMFSAHEGEASSSFFGSSVTTATLDKPFLEMGSIKKDLEDVEKQIHQIPVEGKFTGDVLFTPGCLGSFLQSIVSYFLSDGVILDKTSIWKDKLGKKVADERFTLSFQPFDNRIVRGEHFTEEGFLSEDFHMIKNGVLESFFLSLYVANKTGNQRAKNTSFACIIEGGDISLEDMIQTIQKGIIVGRFSGGAPGANGDFSGVAKNSFLVENGKIVGAINETMINGNMADILNHMGSISKETVEDGTSVLPYITFHDVVISGK